MVTQFSGFGVEVNIVNDKKMASINEEYRKIAKSTDILSLPGLQVTYRASLI
jgi:ssRNA-specific RNase YbeY (16S rRNA maturation enzyme)